MKSPEPTKVYQFKVTLKHISPPVWRRILVSDKSTLQDLHNVIQDVFGWLDYHLHDFTIQNQRYGDPAVDEYGELNFLDETKVRLRKLNLKEGARFTYEYDFGDSWEHILTLEKILPLEKGMELPQCVKGKRACPPEDVGGPWGYEAFLEAVRDPQNSEHETLLEWIGDEFDPDAFDLDAVNQRLRQRAEPGWAGSTPPAVDEGQTGQVSPFDPTRLVTLLREAGDQIPQTLPLRQDVVSFLTYLKENKVTGTQSTGNLPRKAVEAVAARFVNPPLLESKIGDTVYRFQSEVEVWPVYFVHVLASAGELVTGAPGRRWLLTPAGEKFLTLQPVFQLWLLFITWWFGVNWSIAYHWDIFGGEIPENFNKTAASLLLERPVDEPTPFEPFADQLIKQVGFAWPKQEQPHTRMMVQSAIEDMVIDPLENFAILTTQREKDPSRLLDIPVVKSFTITSFGRVFLQLLREME